eukprot:gnl/MRDRNA2_/MRDRNA2_91957_c0_seq1.p1 gnl/MRDRNA2_/MRDRNA2_91957_c0~~gnl/MRDRNA2_/MRDRNA2_91957_c0_seq1.p1  ORF type:complete len:554 (+),score=140.76 gnl/MRDRNA2_/MRDRNA2_91957_c0_seq1:44-1663(+)
MAPLNSEPIQCAADSQPAPSTKDNADHEEDNFSDEDWDSADDWPDDIWGLGDSTKSNGGYSGTTGGARQPERLAQLQRLKAKVNFEFLPRDKCSHEAQNSITRSEKKADQPRNLGLTQDTRKTVEQCLDPRTMIVLSKFLKRGLFDEIFGCISTGKEANVYYATSTQGERAVKVYKTSILVFKDRARYVEGEHRFRRGVAPSSNPRKMVTQWAEKEMRNLKRLQAAGLNCPEVIEVRQNVLVMEFLGEDGKAAPKLKDAPNVSSDGWTELYVQTMVLMRRMFQECHLVHGDLSEYNMLYFKNEVYLIDVSQSVEHEHPRAMQFLKRDCLNVRNFFRKHCESTLPVKTVFEFITEDKLPPERPSATDRAEPQDEIAAALWALLETAEPDEDDEVQDEVFLNTWMHTSMKDIYDRQYMEREIDKRNRGEVSQLDNLVVDRKPIEQADEDEKGSTACSNDEALPSKTKKEDPEGDAEVSEEGSEDDSEDDTDGKAKKDGHRPEGMTKAEWKAMVKAENREKRKEKIPKALKKKFRAKAAKGR